MLILVIHCFAVFVVLVPGMGLLLARRLPLDSRERMVVAWLGGIIGLYLLASGLFLAGVTGAHWRWLAVAAAAGWASSWREAWRWWREPAARRLLGLWLLTAAGALTALAFIRNYSGGDWIGDWAGHYQRTMFFLHQNPADRWIFQLDPLAARPPLQNLVTAALLAFSPGTFAHYQVLTTLLGTLVVLPLGLVAAQAGGNGRAAGWLPLLLLLNPMFIENVTYAWTKLGCAALVLTGMAFGLRACSTHDSLRWFFAVTALTAGILAHFSAAPYFIVLTGLYFWCYRQVWRKRGFWARTAGFAALAGGLLATSFGWMMARHGVATTLEASTTAQYLQSMTRGQQLAAFGQNLARTLLPPPLLPIDHDFLRHANLAATIRDYAFCVYQTCLPFMAGSGCLGVLIGCMAMRKHPPVLRLGAVGWLSIVALIGLGVAAHVAPVRWGVGHICLQPLALAAVAVTAAQIPRLPSQARRWLAAALVIDGILGVGLQLYLEHLLIPPDVLAFQNGAALRDIYGLGMANNAAQKQALGYVFVGDAIGAPLGLVGAAVAILAVAIRQALRPEQAAVDLSPLAPP